MKKKIIYWFGRIVIGILCFVFFLYWQSLPHSKSLPKGGYGSFRQAASASPYPIVKWVKIYRDRWSEPVVISKMERMDSFCYDDIPLLVADDGEVHPQNAATHLDMKGVRDHRATSFRIAPKADPSVAETDIKCIITQR